MNKVEIITPQINEIQNNFYKCKSEDYSYYEKGIVYPGTLIVEHVKEYPKDWQKVLPYPTTKEIIDAIENGTKIVGVLSALKQWKKTM